jgi:hypothetical protein
MGLATTRGFDMRHLIVAIAAFVPLIPAAALAGRMVTFDVPNARVLDANSINDKGDIAGSFIDFGGAQHAFVRAHDGTITTFDVGTSTVATGISHDGSTTGLSGSYPFVAFLRSPDGNIVTFSAVPGYSTYPSGINDNDEITGGYDRGHIEHGFIRAKNGVVTTFNLPNGKPIGTGPEGINNNGDVVGITDNETGIVGFIRMHDRSVITFGVPGSDITTALAINDLDAVTGWYQDHAGIVHGFVRDATGTISTFDGSTKTSTTWANDINNDGTAVGFYEENVGQNQYQHGFVRTADGKIVPIIQADSVIQLTAERINSSGVIAGSFQDAAGWHGFIRTP